MSELSPKGSGLALTYLGKANDRLPHSLFLRFIGEPLRAAFAPSELAARARTAGWETVSDTGLADWQPELAPSISLSERSVGLQWTERIWVGRKP
jgi:hypothetical protein